MQGIHLWICWQTFWKVTNASPINFTMGAHSCASINIGLRFTYFLAVWVKPGDIVAQYESLIIHLWNWNCFFLWNRPRFLHAKAFQKSRPEYATSKKTLAVLNCKVRLFIDDTFYSSFSLKMILVSLNFETWRRLRNFFVKQPQICLLYTSPSPRD